MTWWLVGAWLVALALCARWVWRSIKVDEIMSRGWLEEHNGEEEEDRRLDATDEEDIEEEGRLKAEAGEEGEELNRFGQADLDAFYRDVEKVQRKAIETRAPSSPGRRHK